MAIPKFFKLEKRNADKKKLGIYVHIPFCRSKCQYCDFYSLGGSREKELSDLYMHALPAHIREFGARATEYTVDTVYFGGGTPSFFGADALVRIFNELQRRFDVASDAEVTFEANPDSASPALLQKLHSEGFNRMSLGVQNDNDEVLKLTSTRMVCANIGQIVVQAGFPIGLAIVAHTIIDWNQAIFMAIGTIPAFIILPSLPFLKRLTGKKGLYYLLLSIGFVGFVILFCVGKFFDVESCNTLIQAAKVMTGVGLLVGSLMWALVPEVITEAEYRTGNRPAATVNALAGVAFKAGFSIAGWITPLVMGMIGFNLASEASALPTSPKAWFTVTCVFALFGFVLLLMCFTGCKERIATTPEKPVTYGEMFAEFKANKCLQLVLSIFIVVFLASFISAPVNAYYTKLNEYSPTAQNAILWFTCIIPAILLIVVGCLVYKYPLTDEKLDQINKEIENNRL